MAIDGQASAIEAVSALVMLFVIAPRSLNAFWAPRVGIEQQVPLIRSGRVLVLQRQHRRIDE
jgi:hypothetical protein